MEINFSRHATRRANLYGINQSTIVMVLKETELRPGTHEIIKQVKDFNHPLKMVVNVENDIITLPAIL